MVFQPVAVLLKLPLTGLPQLTSTLLLLLCLVARTQPPTLQQQLGEAVSSSEPHFSYSREPFSEEPRISREEFDFAFAMAPKAGTARDEVRRQRAACCRVIGAMIRVALMHERNKRRKG